MNSILPPATPDGFSGHRVNRLMTDNYFRSVLTKESRSMIVSGLPGVGKTTTASGIVRNLRKSRENVLVAFAFFCHNKTEIHDATSIILVFVNQLVEQNVHFARYAQALHTGPDGINAEPDDILAVLEKLFKRAPRVCIVLDALDEFGDKVERDILLRHVTRLQRNTGVGVIVTERRGVSISERCLSESGKTKMLPIQANLNDIKSYIKFRIESGTSSWIARHLSRTPLVSQSIIERIRQTVMEAAMTGDMTDVASQPMLVIRTSSILTFELTSLVSCL